MLTPNTLQIVISFAVLVFSGLGLLAMSRFTLGNRSNSYPALRTRPLSTLVIAAALLIAFIASLVACIVITTSLI